MSSYNVGQQFGVLDVGADGVVTGFREKQELDGSMINIGFMVCEPGLFDVIDGDDTVLEKAPLETLARQGPAAKLLPYRVLEMAWITSGTKSSWKRCGPPAMRPWKVWQE